ncbi:MAG: hypothetical protein AABW72_04535 [archaeon]
MEKKEWISILAAVILLLLVILILPDLTKKEVVKCESEECLYNNFINCTPATLGIKPYDKIGITSITIFGFEDWKCKYWITSTPHASDIPQIKKGELPMDSLTKENFDKIVEEAKNL